MNTNALNFNILQVIFLVLRNNFDLIMGHRRQPNLQLAGYGADVDDEHLLLLSLLGCSPPGGPRIT
jgi:hypothetical protein